MSRRDDAAIIDARLRECSRWSATNQPRPAIDMSSEAITARLQEASDLSELCFALSELKKIRTP